MSGPSYMPAWLFQQDSCWPRSLALCALPLRVASTYWRQLGGRSGNPLKRSHVSGHRWEPPSNTRRQNRPRGPRLRPVRSNRMRLGAAVMKTPSRSSWKQSDGGGLVLSKKSVGLPLWPSSLSVGICHGAGGCLASSCFLSLLLNSHRGQPPPYFFCCRTWEHPCPLPRQAEFLRHQDGDISSRAGLFSVGCLMFVCHNKVAALVVEQKKSGAFLVQNPETSTDHHLIRSQKPRKRVRFFTLARPSSVLFMPRKRLKSHLIACYFLEKNKRTLGLLRIT